MPRPTAPDLYNSLPLTYGQSPASTLVITDNDVTHPYSASNIGLRSAPAHTDSSIQTYRGAYDTAAAILGFLERPTVKRTVVIENYYGPWLLPGMVVTLMVGVGDPSAEPFTAQGPYQITKSTRQSLTGAYTLELTDVAGWRPGSGLTSSGAQAVSNAIRTAGAPPTGWTVPAFENGWAQYNGWSKVGYRMDSDGFVHLRGLIYNGTLGAAMFHLPAGFRPGIQLLVGALTNPNTACRMEVHPDGSVYSSSGATNAWIALDGITFFAEQPGCVGQRPAPPRPGGQRPRRCRCRPHRHRRAAGVLRARCCQGQPGHLRAQLADVKDQRDKANERADRAIQLGEANAEAHRDTLG